VASALACLAALHSHAARFCQRDAPPVIVLFGNDKAQMGDVFYSSVGSRADQVIAAYLRLTDGGDDD
jgi:hypothetical protein